ncbi:hypothetical protein NOR_00820 [Metarhizium rileyi]|uniref:AB hydrolase-1 domain-containing protein n=1 Tax=Metarhizium rileyi (strain RCEF 4871) TaxID=1649241 RepID=A0A162M466_METRR|nr:hypothetical protein NOR_00820 [Metarhizium rileyi RCEF 4871]TWU75731.1 hypothetical protein ED733_000210 [Metarhizium rileyi]
MFKSVLILALAAMASARQCQNLTVPVNISTRNAIFNLNPPSTEIEVTDFLLKSVQVGQNHTDNLLQDYQTVSGNYTLAATYCQPDQGPGDTIQILTHGIGFDRSYWDLSYANYNYSYVNRAIGAGYSTLSWDRLGVGESSHGDPVNEIQITLEIAALKALTDMAREGNLCGVESKFSKTAHVGHSFGAAMTYGLTAMEPDISNGIVLTGFSQVPDYIPYFALGANFAPVSANEALAAQYAPGYVAPKDSIGVHTNFFGPGDFDPELLKIATETGQPAAVGELLTLGSGPETSDYPGPVMIITGDRDIPFCGGTCSSSEAINDTAPNLLEYSKPNFKKASAFKAVVVPDAGHGLNMNFNAGSTYDSIMDFLKTELK